MKYKLRADLTKNYFGTTLFRIERISNGELGGWIQQESNLSQEGGCWIADNAQVSDSARVSGSAWVYGNAVVFGDVQVSGGARVYGNAAVYGAAQVSGSARVSGSAVVFGDVQVSKPEHLVSLSIPQGFNITVTPQNVTIGCKTKTRKEWGKVTAKQAEEMGLSKKLYKSYKVLLKGAYSIVEEQVI